MAPDPGTLPAGLTPGERQSWRARLRLGSTRFGPGRFAYRLRVLAADRRMVRRRPADALHYLIHSRELTNFTYELENEPAVVSFVASGLGVGSGQIEGLMKELEEDRELMAELEARLRQRPDRDDQPRLGKRRALYCVVRAMRPKVVAEAGTHDGMGTAVLMRALERNAEDGSPGTLLTFDIEPESGWLVDERRHAGRLKRIIGDINETLEPALEEHGVDLFIHDSLIAAGLERFEYECALRHPRGPRVVLFTVEGATGALARLCEECGASYRAVQERPLHHYWRGNELGLAVIAALSSQLPFA